MENIKQSELKIEHIESCEIEDEISYEIGFDFDKDTLLQYSIKSNDKYFQFNGGCNIDAVIERLTTMRSMGATHVFCDFNEDHQSIMIDGFRVGKASDEEAQDDLNRLNDIANKQRETAILAEKVIQGIKNKLRESINTNIGD